MKLNNIVKPRNGVVILHFGRAGSTLLLTLIAQNKIFYNESEVVEKIKTGDITLDDKLQKNPGYIFYKRAKNVFYRRYLVSVKPTPEQHLHHQFLNMNYKELLKHLQYAGINKFVIVKRKNYLKQTISRLQAVKRKKYHYTLSETPKIQKVTVPFHNCKLENFSGELITLFKKYDAYYNEIEKLTPNPLLLTYENDIEDNPMIEYQKLSAYLNLGKKSPKIVLQKSNIFNNDEVIENYEELKEYLNNTPYSWML